MDRIHYIKAKIKYKNLKRSMGCREVLILYMGIKFLNNGKNESLHCQLYVKCLKADKARAERAKELVFEEYAKYPKLIEASRLKVVNLVSGLYVKNNIIMKVSSTPDPEASWMYLDVDYIDNEPYFRESINHEFWHLLDHALTGSFTPDDPEWIELNSWDFKYGQGGWTGYQAGFTNGFHQQKGFITNYATLGIDEDKAELFMYMQTDHLKSKLEEVMEVDEIVEKKVASMQRRIVLINSLIK